MNLEDDQRALRAARRLRAAGAPRVVRPLEDRDAFVPHRVRRAITARAAVVAAVDHFYKHGPTICGSQWCPGSYLPRVLAQLGWCKFTRNELGAALRALMAERRVVAVVSPHLLPGSRGTTLRCVAPGQRLPTREELEAIVMHEAESLERAGVRFTMSWLSPSYLPALLAPKFEGRGAGYDRIALRAAMRSLLDDGRLVRVKRRAAAELAIAREGMVGKLLPSRAPHFEPKIPREVSEAIVLSAAKHFAVQAAPITRANFLAALNAGGLNPSAISKNVLGKALARLLRKGALLEGDGFVEIAPE